ncbi:MAG: DUF1015 domain-containing protein [Pseudomonadales bacterium]|nr:DUF1015 domain-containing protein [Pseudomonadales bacterium]
MSLIRPFTGLRPVPARAADVLAPPYDVLSSAEAREQAANRPASFLHVSKPEIDLPPGVDPYSEAVYAKGAENLQRLIEQAVLQRDPMPHYYIYRLEMNGHRQTGIVVAASVAAYDEGRIRRHEFTRPDKEDDRVRHIEALNAQTGPVFLVHRADGELDRGIERLTVDEPEVDVTTHDGVRHSLWVVREDSDLGLISQRIEALGRLYIADGHHRSAAASRVAEKRRARGDGGDAPSQYFLAVTFPHDQVNILDYNRVITDLGRFGEPAAFLEALRGVLEVTEVSGPCKPAHAASFGMYLDGSWYRLRVAPESLPEDPVASLDVSLLHDRVIEPLLDISDPRRDKRIDFVGGIRGLQALEQRVDSGEMAVAFALFPTSLEALMAVADAGEVMPPKSTWFEPKLADGMVSHLLY